MLSQKELQSMNLKSLLDLEDKLDEAIKARKQTERHEVKQKLAEAAKRDGFTLDEIFGKTRKGYKDTLAPKFANPDNRLETWVGKGRKPNWLLGKLSKGASVDDFRI